MKKIVAVLITVVLALPLLAAAQGGTQGGKPRPSPAEKAVCKLPDGKTVTVNYSSPRAKGRKIFGGLVPYGQVWRTGANEATTFEPTANVTVGNKDVPAGNYTIFTVPDQSKWTLVISKDTGEWGIPYPGEKDDFARVDMNVSQTPSAVENFTIAFDQSSNGCTLRIEWENTRASVAVTEKK